MLLLYSITVLFSIVSYLSHNIPGEHISFAFCKASNFKNASKMKDQIINIYKRQVTVYIDI